jgi:hypothetical protein
VQRWCYGGSALPKFPPVSLAPIGAVVGPLGRECGRAVAQPAEGASDLDAYDGHEIAGADATSPWSALLTRQGRLHLPISSRGMSPLRGETMRLVLALCLVLVMACVAILFPTEVVDLISWVEEDWFDEQS